jgi:hypothetical protein
MRLSVAFPFLYWTWHCLKVAANWLGLSRACPATAKQWVFDAAITRFHRLMFMERPLLPIGDHVVNKNRRLFSPIASSATQTSYANGRAE